MERERIYAAPSLARPEQIRQQGHVESESAVEMVVRHRVPSRAGTQELSYWRKIPLSREGYWERYRSVERPAP